MNRNALQICYQIPRSKWQRHRFEGGLLVVQLSRVNFNAIRMELTTLEAVPREPDPEVSALGDISRRT